MYRLYIVAKHLKEPLLASHRISDRYLGVLLFPSCRIRRHIVFVSQATWIIDIKEEVIYQNIPSLSPILKCALRFASQVCHPGTDHVV